MRSLCLLVVTTGLTGSGIAMAQSSLPPVDPGSIPAACSAVATPPADATIPQPALAARIALASCGAEARFNGLTVGPDDASLTALSAAIKPSVDQLDAVIQVGDATWTPVAQKARADLFISIVVRARNSIPAITSSTVGPDLAAHDAAHAALEPKIKPWLAQVH